MLEGFKVIKDGNFLWVIRVRMHGIHKKLLEKKPLTEEEEKQLKLYLFADEGPGRTFVNDDHRLQLIEQWLKEAVVHEKSLKEREEKAKANK